MAPPLRGSLLHPQSSILYPLSSVPLAHRAGRRECEHAILIPRRAANQHPPGGRHRFGLTGLVKHENHRRPPPAGGGGRFVEASLGRDTVQIDRQVVWGAAVVVVE